VAVAQFLGMDAGGDEQAIDSHASGSSKVGAHRIADRRHSLKVGFQGEAEVNRQVDRTESVENDPEPTSACTSCCSNEYSFSPYQSTQLSRYDASPEPGAGMRRREFIGVLGNAASD
jgi:hypothetical protein